MPARSQEDRALVARIAAHSKWAKTADPSAATAPARKAFNARFERQVDPDGTLEPAERARRAEHARRAYFASLALKSVRARRRGKELLAEADAADAELSTQGGDVA
jgi:ketosteroid isomerase-like protein